MAELIGLRETMTTLRRDMPKEMYWASMNEIKAAAKPLADAVNASVPASSPFAGRSHDGFDHNGRTSWRKRGKATVKYGGRKYRARPDAWPLVRIVFSGAAGEMTDLAANGTLAANLGGTPSRYIWPAANAHIGDVEQAVKAAADKAAERVNRKLAHGRVI